MEMAFDLYIGRYLESRQFDSETFVLLLKVHVKLLETRTTYTVVSVVSLSLCNIYPKVFFFREIVYHIYVKQLPGGLFSYSMTFFQFQNKVTFPISAKSLLYKKNLIPGITRP